MSRLVGTLGEARKIALALPEAMEADHFGNPSFRVGGRTFATAPDATHLNVMIDPFEVEAAIREDPEACSELWWGKELRGVRVDLAHASAHVLGDLLRGAWRRKAPRRLLTAAGKGKGSGSHVNRKRAAGG